MIVIFSVTLPVFAFIATGALAARLELLGAEATNVLNKFVVYLALPALLFDATARIRWALTGKASRRSRGSSPLSAFTRCRCDTV